MTASAALTVGKRLSDIRGDAMPIIYRCEGCQAETVATNLYAGKCPEPADEIRVLGIAIHVWAQAELDPPPDHVPADWVKA